MSIVTLRNEWRLYEDLESLLEIDSFQDVTFLCDDSPVKAHRLVLGCASLFLRGLLSEVGPEGEDENYRGRTTNNLSNVHVSLPGVSSHILRHVLLFAYTGNLKAELFEAADLYQVAQMLGLDPDDVSEVSSPRPSPPATPPPGQPSDDESNYDADARLRYSSSSGSEGEGEERENTTPMVMEVSAESTEKSSETTKEHDGEHGTGRGEKRKKKKELRVVVKRLKEHKGQVLQMPFLLAGKQAVCMKCGQILKTHAGITRHENFHAKRHTIQYDSTSSFSAPIDTQTPVENNGSLHIETLTSTSDVEPMDSEHQREIANRTPTQIAISSSSMPPENPPHKCSRCQITFYTTSLFQNHVADHQFDMLPDTDEVPDVSNPETQIRDSLTVDQSN